jgi:predicted DNA-binding antitoxin AbrB/MazE fold protein
MGAVLQAPLEMVEAAFAAFQASVVPICVVTWRWSRSEEPAMATSVLAVYENGVLRPVQPLPLAEGETVEITVAPVRSASSAQADEEAIRRIRAARTVAEWVEATKLLPADDGGYDILQALNANRMRSGERPLLPDENPTP